MYCISVGSLLVPAVGGIFTQEAVLSHECGAELCGHGGLLLPGGRAADRRQCVALPGLCELWKADQGCGAGICYHGDRGGLPGNSGQCNQRGQLDVLVCVVHTTSLFVTVCLDRYKL